MSLRHERGPGCARDVLAHGSRLVRRSQYFTRLLRAVRDAVKLFDSAWNRRQLFRRTHPTHPARVFQFACPPS